MHFVSDEITRYSVNQSAPVSPVCEELEAYTRANVEMSIMLSGPLEASLLGFLIKTIPARRVLEIGTFTGYCALAMAGFLPDDGEVVTLDVNEKTTAIAKRFWERDPNGKKITSVLGPALETLERLEATFDLIFLDAIKSEYVAYLEKSFHLLSDRGIYVADNTLMSGDVLNVGPSSEGVRGMQQFNEYVKSRKDLYCTLLPVRDGVSLIRRR
ncbi:MAG: class I SAM-dependent methyltransferase [Bdellovibrionales bacterium]|nr:class I SAM-dependent methyltransferase [Bdellovibrionales bacterium]